MLPVTHWSSYGAYGPCLCEKGDGETGTHKTSLCPRDRDLKETRWLKTQDDDASIGAQSRRDTLTMAAKMGTSGEGFSMSKIRHALLQGEGYFLGKGIFCFSTKDKLSVCSCLRNCGYPGLSQAATLLYNCTPCPQSPGKGRASCWPPSLPSPWTPCSVDYSTSLATIPQSLYCP